MKMKTVNIYYKNVYGNDLCYPACVDSKIFASISGQKTLSSTTIDRIKRLGYAVNVVAYNKPAF